MSAEKKDQSLAMIAIVAIVAIVGIMILFKNSFEISETQTRESDFAQTVNKGGYAAHRVLDDFEPDSDNADRRGIFNFLRNSFANLMGIRNDAQIAKDTITQTTDREEPDEYQPSDDFKPENINANSEAVYQCIGNQLWQCDSANLFNRKCNHITTCQYGCRDSACIEENLITANICNDGRNYELTGDNRVFEGKKRKPTSYILPGGSIRLGIKNIDTGAIYYTDYTFESNKPSLVKVENGMAYDLVGKYDDYDMFIDITVPELMNCDNVKQPLGVLIGDPYLGENTAYVYPKSIIPKEVLNLGQDWATISVDEAMQRFSILRISELVYDLQTHLFSARPMEGDGIILTVMPPWCGGAGHVIGIGVGCLIQPNNDPQWNLIFHEIGHVFTGHFQVELVDGIGGIYPTNRNIFMQNLERHYDIALSESTATLASMYANHYLIKDASQYDISGEILTSLATTYNNHFNYLNDLKIYEEQGSNFDSINANIIDGMFLRIMNDSSINQYGWEVFPRAMKIYAPNSLPEFVMRPLSSVQSKTYFIAGLSAAADHDLRPLFRDWGFEIDDQYYELIYPILYQKITRS